MVSSTFYILHFTFICRDRRDRRDRRDSGVIKPYIRNHHRCCCCMCKDEKNVSHDF